MAKTNIKFEDYSDKVSENIKSSIIKALHEAAGTIVSQAKQNSRVDTGQLKGSWDYQIDSSKYEAHVGSPLQNAIWEEFGTGEYAVNGNGRKGGWKYVDRKGKGHFTRGKTPNQTLTNAFKTKKKSVEAIFERNLKN